MSDSKRNLQLAADFVEREKQAGRTLALFAVAENVNELRRSDGPDFVPYAVGEFVIDVVKFLKASGYPEEAATLVYPVASAVATILPKAA